MGVVHVPVSVVVFVQSIELSFDLTCVVTTVSPSFTAWFLKIVIVPNHSNDAPTDVAPPGMPNVHVGIVLPAGHTPPFQATNLLDGSGLVESVTVELY
jgi:hypothetical protein